MTGPLSRVLFFTVGGGPSNHPSEILMTWSGQGQGAGYWQASILLCSRESCCVDQVFPEGLSEEGTWPVGRGGTSRGLGGDGQRR